MDAETMRRNGDNEKSIAYWQAQQVYWNGEPVQRQEPSQRFNPISNDEE